MNNKNYMKLLQCGTKSMVGGIRFPWQVEYMYIDSINYFADQLLINHGVENAKFKDMINNEHPNEILVFIKFSKKYETKFISAMHELKDKCLLCGFTDYEERYTAFFEGFKNFQNAGKEN